MERDVPAVKELLRSVEALASDAKILAVAGVSISERIQWENSLMSFKNLIHSLEWVVKNTESELGKHDSKPKTQSVARRKKRPASAKRAKAGSEENFEAVSGPVASTR